MLKTQDQIVKSSATVLSNCQKNICLSFFHCNCKILLTDCIICFSPYRSWLLLLWVIDRFQLNYLKRRGKTKIFELDASSLWDFMILLNSMLKQWTCSLLTVLWGGKGRPGCGCVISSNLPEHPISSRDSGRSIGPTGGTSAHKTTKLLTDTDLGPPRKEFFNLK